MGLDLYLNWCKFNSYRLRLHQRLCSCGFELDHVCARAQLVQVVGPALHHHAPGWQVCRVVVGPPVGILCRMGQLVLNQVHPFIRSPSTSSMMVRAVARNPWPVCKEGQGVLPSFSFSFFCRVYTQRQRLLLVLKAVIHAPILSGFLDMQLQPRPSACFLPAAAWPGLMCLTNLSVSAMTCLLLLSQLLVFVDTITSTMILLAWHVGNLIRLEATKNPQCL